MDYNYDILSDAEQMANWEDDQERRLHKEAVKQWEMELKHRAKNGEKVNLDFDRRFVPWSVQEEKHYESEKRWKEQLDYWSKHGTLDERKLATKCKESDEAFAKHLAYIEAKDNVSLVKEVKPKVKNKVTSVKKDTRAKDKSKVIKTKKSSKPKSVNSSDKVYTAEQKYNYYTRRISDSSLDTNKRCYAKSYVKGVNIARKDADKVYHKSIPYIKGYKTAMAVRYDQDKGKNVKESKADKLVKK